MASKQSSHRPLRRSFFSGGKQFNKSYNNREQPRTTESTSQSNQRRRTPRYHNVKDVRPGQAYEWHDLSNNFVWYNDRPFDLAKKMLSYHKQQAMKECPICCEPMAFIAMGPCCDIVCWVCMAKIRCLENSKKCPYCQKHLDYVTILETPFTTDKDFSSKLCNSPSIGEISTPLGKMYPNTVEVANQSCGTHTNIVRLDGLLTKIKSAEISKTGASVLETNAIRAGTQNQNVSQQTSESNRVIHSPRIFDTDNIQEFAWITPQLFDPASYRFSLKDESFGILYESSSIKEAVQSLLEYACWDEQCMSEGFYSRLRFSSQAQWIQHLKQRHRLTPCYVCLSERRVFIYEQLLYHPKALQRHIDFGTRLDKDNLVISPHVFCVPCQTYFYDVEVFKEHVKKDHLSCYICDRDEMESQHRQLHAFATFDELNNHYQQFHFTCPKCEYVAFSSAEELQHHVHTTHPGFTCPPQYFQKRSEGISSSSRILHSGYERTTRYMKQERSEPIHHYQDEQALVIMSRLAQDEWVLMAIPMILDFVDTQNFKYRDVRSEEVLEKTLREYFHQQPSLVTLTLSTIDQFKFQQVSVIQFIEALFSLLKTRFLNTNSSNIVQGNLQKLLNFTIILLSL